MRTETGGASFFCISITNANANDLTLDLVMANSASHLISNLAKHDFNLPCLSVITHEYLTIAVAFIFGPW